MSPKRIKIPDDNAIELSAQRMSGSGKRTKEQEIDDLRKIVEEKVAAYKPDDEDENAEFTGTEMVSASEILFRFANSCDLVYFWLGVFGSFGFGAALPGFCLFFGDMIDDMGASIQGQGFDALKNSSFYMLMISFGVAIVCWFQITNMSMFAERIAFKVKLRYFEACLEKDADFYDKNNPTEMTSRISKECSAIQRGIGEKFGNIIMSVSSFIFGYAFAFTIGWILTLILLGGLPLMMCVGGVLGVVVQGGLLEQMRAYAQSAGYAE